MTKASEMLQDKIDAINTKIQEKEGVYAAINKSATKKRQIPCLKLLLFIYDRSSDFMSAVIYWCDNAHIKTHLTT